MEILYEILSFINAILHQNTFAEFSFERNTQQNENQTCFT